MGGYTITQVANLLGIKVHVIRYWEKHISLLSVERDELGRRLYTRHDMFVLIKIKNYVEEKKFTVKGAAEEIIREMSDNTTQNPVLKKDVFHIMKKLEDQRFRLERAKDLLSPQEAMDNSLGHSEVNEKYAKNEE